MAILADDLLSGVKRRISMPASQVLLEDTDILALADGIIRSRICPLFESVQEDFFVTTTTTALVASTSEYDIPYRAMGRALRDIKLRPSLTDNTGIRNLIRIAIEDLEYSIGDSTPAGFYFKGDRIVLSPSVSSDTQTDYLEIWYKMAPNKLVSTSSCATVVSATTTDVTVDATPSSITVLTNTDFIQAKSGNRLYSIDKIPTGVATTTISYTTGDIPSQLSAGDYICLAGYSPVVNMIPDDAYSYLESLLAKRCLMAIGDFEGSSMLDGDIAEEKTNLLKLIEPRVTGEPKIIINRTGLVRGNKSAQLRWLGGV